MTTTTREWLLQTIAEYEANRDELPFGLDTNSAIELQAFKIALASLDDGSDSNSHPAHGPLSNDRLHRISDILSKAAAQSDGGNIGYAMSDAVKAFDELLEVRKAEPAGYHVIKECGKVGCSVTTLEEAEKTREFWNEKWTIKPYFYTAPPAPVSVPDEATPENIAILASTFAPRGVTYQWDDDECNAAADSWNACRAAMLQGSQPVSNRDELPEEKGASLQLRNLIRQRHAEWSDKTFGNVGPVGPLKHLSKEALEAAAKPDDLSEWADMQFLLWDAQRRAGISDGEITAAMEEKLKVNMARQWPEPKDGEPRLHIKTASKKENI